MTYQREDDNDYGLRFSSEQMECCVSIVDMVESTKITSNIKTSNRIAKYYSIFINNMAVIGRKFGGRITKVTGDGLLLYFPQTSNKHDRNAFKNVIECGITMLAAFHFINSRMSEEHLPAVNYRISTDYGKVDIGKSENSDSYDLFGLTVNICSEINRMAASNGMVLGSNLYQIIKSLSPPLLADYQCRLAGKYLVGELKLAYPVYSITTKQQSQLELEQVTSDNTESTNKQKENKIRHSSDPEKILLVDDDSDILLTYKAFLEIEGYIIDTFSDPEDALKHFAQVASSYYDLVLLDIRMPRLNGLQLFYRMKSIDINTKIVFVSALDAAEELLSLLPGIKFDKHIIKKPIGREPFLERISALISEPPT
jgi:two-component system response regulator ChvI